jgi:hypothetical protein
MSNSVPPAGDIVDLELHDAVVSEIAIDERRGMRIVFRHLMVYVRESATTFGEWSYAAQMDLSGLGSLSLDMPDLLGGGRVDEAEAKLGIVVDGCIRNHRGEEVPVVTALAGLEHVVLSMSWTASGTLEARPSRLVLRLVAPGRRLGDWSG